MDKRDSIFKHYNLVLIMERSFGNLFGESDSI